jgi:hypothetical protein
MPICKKWVKSYIVNLLYIDNKARREWNQNYDTYHTIDRWKNNILKINEIVPGFKYFIDIQWELDDDNNVINSNRIGDLIFGSDYGIYLVVETCWLNLSSGSRAEKSRTDDSESSKFKQFATAKYENEAIKVIGASYTNDTK